MHVLAHLFVLLPAFVALAGLMLWGDFLARQNHCGGPLSSPWFCLGALAALAAAMLFPIELEVYWLVGTLVVFPVLVGLLLARGLTARN